MDSVAALPEPKGKGQPAAFCFSLKWPWEQRSIQPLQCEIDTPWLFKSLHSLTALTFNLFNSTIQNISPIRIPVPGGKSPFQSKINHSITQSSSSRRNTSNTAADQAEAEQRALAWALCSGKEATVIEFYSPKCRLCNSLLNFVAEVENRNSDWLNIVMADAENQQWLPELLHYDVKYVPCFVILDKHGRALAKTGIPSSRLHIVAGVSHLLKLRRPREER